MAVSMVAKKSDAVSYLVQMAPKAEALSRDVIELLSYFTDNGFLTGGANAIVDADLVGENQHLTAAQVNAGVAAINSLKLSTANATILRQIARTPVLPHTS
jgi:hypothetical protein